MLITSEDIMRWFTYHRPTEDQLPKYQALRDKAKELALLMLDCVPPGPELILAVNGLRECVMHANQGIACRS